MAKGIKLKLLSRVMPSLQFCRLKHPSDFPVNSILLPKYRLSPVNPKAREILHPNPAPPPSTPDDLFSNRRTSSSNNRSKKENENSWFSSDDEENDSTSMSGSNDSSRVVYSGESVSRKGSKKNGKPKRHVSISKPKIGRSESKVKVLMKLKRLPETVDGRVRESVAVVTKSDDPYEDFKKSMMEMIIEKKMSEAKDLEQLLQCFLSLNSREYHVVIVQAFTEIWQLLFTAHHPY